jgi:uncharacterized protein YecT (DUF1311 family)
MMTRIFLPQRARQFAFRARSMRHVMAGVVMAIAAGANAASFDCTSAKGHAEKIICGDQALSMLDEQLAEQYRIAIQNADGQEAQARIRREQRAWLKRRDACQERACVEDAYRERADALRQASGATEKGHAPLCEKFRKLVNARGALTPYKLEVPPDHEGNMRARNIDVDGDGAPDSMTWSCPGSSGVIPPDPCDLSIKLSSGRTIEFKESRFYLIRYASKIFAVAEDYALVDANRPSPVDVRTKIYRIDGRGAQLICSAL